MPTNDERREVAARLREIDVNNWCIGDFVVSDLEEACGCGHLQPFAHMDINERLAELIEPEPERTCRVLKFSGALCCLPFFKCSECGAFHYSQTNGAVWKYCPECGAKVVE
jgi:hypothetical protein